MLFGLVLRGVLDIVAWRNVARETMGLWTWFWMLFQTVTAGWALARFGDSVAPFVVAEVLLCVAAYWVSFSRLEHEPY